ncbi:MAG: hypothetical protein CMH13_09735 [Martelella sp.]|uniref:TetR/AcrR family transcriptional regulator n=1 Tax=unclassified Martelella TaxID=2629616 RepID=UPI000C4933C7|nr:TetR/AcrR family transcriptional regulator [Martelella sp.]MAU20798.1 hypothetical protein [Martelella sp.]|tara:strand:- start:675 stop:1310 length:636 start_codon:yes stop_codon:yes gene_type:complete
MKVWPDGHPKGKAMARRQRDILDAARACFVRTGYGGTSMDAIAAAAGISLMTLYRHAESKDDLFAATISDACRATDDAERRYFESLFALPFRELLVTSGIHMQAKFFRPDNIALMRLVIAESSVFPHLLQLAYEGIPGHFENLAAIIISAKCDVDDEEIAEAARLYIDCLLGGEVLRLLLGQGERPDADQRRRAELAADVVLGMLEAGPAC